ncbi:MAG: hypothetical protein EP343_30610 [Deltaproteobacteria bacterium]|nr:MAG: hypothetical protein EP343_30610 [Deltaproteobacteria bacterium]
MRAIIYAVGWVSLMGWVVGLGSPAWASAQSCRSMFQAKKFVASGNCFLEQVKVADANKSLSGIRNLLKDRYLRNAAIAFHQASEKQTAPGVRSYWKERAVQALQRSLNKGYCKAARRCRLNQKLVQSLTEKIGYGTLVVVTGVPLAVIAIKGYKFAEQAKGKARLKLRPGAYTVEVKAPGRAVNRRNVTIKRKHRVLVNVTKARVVLRERRILVAKKLPPLVITGYAVGASLAFVGAVLAVVGVASQANLNSQRSDPELQANLQEDAYHRDFDTAGSLVVAGGVASGAGLLVLAGGIVGHVTANRAANAKKEIPELRSNFQLQGSVTLLQR